MLKLLRKHSDIKGEHQMTFTAGQVFAFVIAVVGLILTVLNIYDKATAIKKAAGEPFDLLEKRVTALEVKQVENETRFHKGNDQFAALYEYTRMFMQVQLAFVDFEKAFCQHTNYTDTEDLDKAKQLLNDKLTDIK